jgi:hypothetical protein
MAEIGDLGDEFIGQNQAVYEGLDVVAEHAATAFETSGVSGALRSKGAGQSGCFPAALVGTTFAFEAPTGTYVSTQIPGGPPDGVRFLIYEVNGGAPTENDIGTVDVTCTGALPSVNVNVIVTSDEVVLLNLLASNAYFAADSFNATQLSGFLSNADGTDQVPFSNGTIGIYTSGLNEFLEFEVGENTYAQITHSALMDTGSGATETAFVNVFRNSSSFDRLFDYSANLAGMPGNLSGGGTFYAAPPVGDYSIAFVNCFEGSLEEMTVSAADPACLLDQEGYEPFPLSEGDLNAIQDAADALFSMFNAVMGVASTGGEIGMAIAASQLPTL